MNNFIKSITIENYRGFAQKQTLELSDFNNFVFLVGPNNSGKSLIARLFNVFKNSYNNPDLENFSDNDFYDLRTNEPIKFMFELNFDLIKSKIKEFENQKLHDLYFCFYINKEYSNRYKRYIFLQTNKTDSHFLERNQNRESIFLLNDKIYKQIGRLNNALIEVLITKIFNLLTDSFLIFEPIRAFDKAQQNSLFKTGNELINWIKNKEVSDKVTKVNRQIKLYYNLLNLEVPVSVDSNYENKQFSFKFNDFYLTSDEIGTGYSMLYILLMEILRNENRQLIIIDEIESHLQPGLIRILIEILRNIEYGGQRRNIQFIIATHSPTVLNCAKENDILYRFQKKNSECTFYKFFKNNANLSEMRKACNDLGVVPGDALLSNVVIWVEGPTEIHWLRALLKNYLAIYRKNYNYQFNLIEGLHYSIMMTGGGLISNFSFEEEDFNILEVQTENLLKVLRINPNPFVIFDFDGVNENQKKYERGLRIANELNKNNKNQDERVLNFLLPSDNDFTKKEQTNDVKNLWWLNAKEIENYCPPDLLRDFYSNLNDNRSKVEGFKNVSDWNVYHTTEGVGTILEKRGLINVKTKSGTIKHKRDLALFVFENLNESHFHDNNNKEQLTDLKNNLEKIFNYIKIVNNLV